jgi:hypothetical protein
MTDPIIKQVPANPTNYSANSYTKVGIVYHWMGGYLTGTDAHFQRPNTKSSTHYGIGYINKKIEIHQYVKDEYYAYANGNTIANRKYLSIEHEGGYKTPTGLKKPTEEVHEASIALTVYLAKKHNFEPRLGVNCWRHTEVSDKYTECCGTLDVDYIVSEAQRILHIINNPMPTDAEWKNVEKWLRDVEEKYGIVIASDYGNNNPVGKQDSLRMFHRFKDYLQKSDKV